jgi:hypothetical protein
MTNLDTTRETVNVGRLTITSNGRSTGQACIFKSRGDALCFARTQ